MKNILKFYGSLPRFQKNATIFCYILVFILTVCNYIQPVIFGNIIDGLGKDSAMINFIVYCGLLLAVQLLEMITAILSVRIGDKNNTHFKLAGFDSMMKRKELTEPEKECDMLDEYTIHRLKTPFYNGTFRFFINMGTMGIVAAYLIYKNLLTGILIILSIALMYFSYKKNQELSEKYSSVINDKESEIVGTITDSFYGFTESRIFSAIDIQLNFITGYIKSVEKLFKEMAEKELKIKIYINTFNVVVFPVIFAIIGVCIYNGSLRLGEGLGLMQLIAVFQNNMSAVIECFPYITRVSEDIKLFAEKYGDEA